MKKVCFIIPYFGKFPNYFQLFLNSCKNNKNFNWLIFTDDKTSYVYPENVEVIYTKFEILKNDIQNKFNFKISLDTPYKFCDFKPAYGYIFQEYLMEYKYWGYCDLDLIFGDLSKFITDNLLEKYEKLFIYGHLTIFKNTEKLINLFKNKLGNEEVYLKYFSDSKIYGFDELYGNGINTLCKEYGISLYEYNYSADIYRNSLKFKLALGYDEENKKDLLKDTKNDIYLYENGKIQRYWLEKNKLNKEEYIYIHLQKRKMIYLNNINYNENYQIFPNSFSKIDDKITEENFINYSRKIKVNNYIQTFIEYEIKRKLKTKVLRYLSRIKAVILSNLNL